MKTGRQSSNSPQRRGAPRITSRLPMVVGNKKAVTQDISATGICFEYDEQHEIGSVIQFWVSLDTPGGPLKLNCEAEVARVEKNGEKVMVGVKILNQTIEVLKDSDILKTKLSGDQS